MQTKNAQTLLDAAMQQTGDVTGVAALAQANGLGITDKLPTGTQLQDAAVTNAAVVQNFTTQQVLPASDDNVEIREGIDFWRIGVDFKVSNLPNPSKGGATGSE